jgi:hypothetical protein
MSSLLPHCLPDAFWGATLVETLARLDNSRGNILLVLTSWPRRHGSCLGSLAPNQSLICCPVAHQKNHSGTEGPGSGPPSFVTGPRLKKIGWTDSFYPDKGWPLHR